MKKKQSAKYESKSLGTFFVYSFVVLMIILIALSIRAFIIFRQSIFDGHNITIAITHNKNVVSVVGIDSDKRSISILEITKGKVSLENLPQELGILTESKIDSKINFSGESADAILAKAIYRADGTRTDLTIIDQVRLYIFSKSLTGKDTQKEELIYPEEKLGVDRLTTSLFSDSNIARENLSIQIINATEIAGLGQRLERVITNKGGNVIAVSSSRTKEAHSKIKYYGVEGYTVKKLGRILKYPSEKLKDKSIGEIVIIIGEDYKNATAF